MSAAPALESPRDALPAGAAVIDCDVHAVVPSVEALFPYLAEHWREYITQSRLQGADRHRLPAKRADVGPTRRAARGGAARLEPRRCCASRRSTPGAAEVAILNCAYARRGDPQPRRRPPRWRGAVNDWLVAEWLDREPRLRASIVVPVKQPRPGRARDRPRRRAPRLRAGLLPVRSAAPYGNREYLPDLRGGGRGTTWWSALHFGGAPGNPPTAVGWPSYYLEEYAGMAQVFQTQLMSMVARGSSTASRRCGSRCVESGWAWLPPFLWRFDKEWKGLRREIPWMRRRRREYIREHVRLTLQPFDGPPDAARLLAPGRPARLGRAADVLDRLPALALRRAGRARCRPTCPRAARKIMSGNARAFYRFGGTHDAGDASAGALAAREARSIDCDIHNAPAVRRRRCSVHAARVARAARRRPTSTHVRRRASSAAARTTRVPEPARARRTDAWPPDGLTARLRPRVHARAAARPLGHRVRRPRLRCSAPASSSTSSAGAALARAVERLAGRRVARPRAAPARLDRGPVRGRPELAAAEIDRRGARPALRAGARAQSRTREPLGRRSYWPIYEAAGEHGLPIGIHFGGSGGRADHRRRLALVLHRGPRRAWPSPSRPRSSAWSARASSSASRRSSSS